jgi:hypothetical protein
VNREILGTVKAWERDIGETGETEKQEKLRN